MVELVNNIENLEFIIAKAREYDVQVPATDEDSGSNASDDNEVDILDASLTNPTRKELFAAIRSLNIDERQELLALMWVGRGDFSVDEWDEALSTAADRDNGREASILSAHHFSEIILRKGWPLWASRLRLTIMNKKN